MFLRVVLALGCLGKSALQASAAAASASPAFSSSTFPLSCKSESQANPIAAQYPHDTTGTINGTNAILPIPLSVARSIIPAQYGILTAAYRHVFPNLPADTYPALLEAVLDHDVQQAPVHIPDFARIALKFPFVDRLNDGYTSFKFTSLQLISANLVALLGSEVYGASLLGNFDPECNAYASDGHGATYVKAYTAPKSGALGSVPDFDASFSTVSSIPYSLKAFMNVTNQPSFGTGLPVCDNYLSLFNSTLTTGPNAPVPVKGTVSVKAPFYPTTTTFKDVYGYRLDLAFIEKNLVPCEKLQGYAGTGPGDSG